VTARRDGVSEDDVSLAPARGRQIDVAAMQYAAVGGGSSSPRAHGQLLTILLDIF
jgi:hypothetical protein